MKKQYDNTDAYYMLVSIRILRLAPVVAACSAVTFTLARLAGFFAFADLTSLICFDAVCLGYFIVAFILRKSELLKNEGLSGKTMSRIEVALDLLILLQWNLITYIFPTRSFWGYAPLFVMMSAFLFHTKSVLAEIIGISLSIAVSWLIKGDMLLPAEDGLFAENMILRILALALSFTVIYLLTHFAEKFTLMVKESFKDISAKNDELETMGRDIIDFAADIVEARDATSGSHVKRLKIYTRILAEQLRRDYPEYELDDEKIDRITLACVLHDVGKIGIPDSILLKPGKLTREEFEAIKNHTMMGAKIIDKLPDSVGEEYKSCCREICLFHHEKYDGKGYPAGLKGDDIPIAAQIVSAVDCYDALTNERPYKSALPGEVAVKMIINGECGTFSDKIKNSIMNCREQLYKA